MIPILSAASAGNQEGAPAPSWNFPRTEDEGRRPPFYCLLLPVAPTIRLAAKRLRRRDPVPGWLMRLSSTTRRARRPGVPPPRPPQVPNHPIPVPELSGNQYPRLPQKQRPLDDLTHPALAPIPRPNVLRNGPRTLGMVSKGRAEALPLVVSRGARGEIRNPPGNLSWEARGDILLI